MTPPAEPTPSPAATRFLLPVTLALFVCGAVWVVSFFCPPLLPIAGLAQALFPLLALAATMLAIARKLPSQNVFAVTLFILLFSAIAETISAKSGIPFGARTYTDAFGPRIFDLLPWPMPFIWAIAILNSRGVARLILRPWRKTGKYGLWVIGLTCALTVILDFNLEPFASLANSWWIWRMPKSVPAWETAPWVNFLAWAVVTLLILAFVTPWLINKQRRASPSEYHSLLLWLLFNLIPAAGDAAHAMWLPAIFAVVLAAVATTFAIRGATW